MLTIEELYEAYMDEGVYAEDPKPFGEDIWEFMGRPGGLEGEFLNRPDLWAEEFGGYFAPFDPVKIGLAQRDFDLDKQKAIDILETSARATDLAYETESEIASTGLGRELEKGRSIAGGLGLRTGSLDKAIEQSVGVTSNKVKALNNRYKLQKDENKNRYRTSVVDATLDFDKSVRQSKEEWYQDTLDTINKLIDQGAFEGAPTSYEKWSGQEPSEHNPEGLCCRATRRGSSYITQCGNRSCDSGCFTCPD